MNLSASSRIGDVGQSLKNWLGIGGGAPVPDVVAVAIAQDLRSPPYSTRRRFTAVVAQTAGAGNTGYIMLYGLDTADIVVDYVGVSCSANADFTLYNIDSPDFAKRSNFGTLTDSGEATINAAIQLAAQTAENIATAGLGARNIDRTLLLASTRGKLDCALPYIVRKGINPIANRTSGGIAVAPAANALTYIVTFGGYFDP